MPPMVHSTQSSMNFASLIRRCVEQKSILNGKTVHAMLIVSGCNPDVYTSNHLMTLYLKLCNLDYARKLFDKMPERNVISWTTLISSYAQMGLSEGALDGVRAMVLDGFHPNDYTYVGAISACTNVGAVRLGKEIHGRITRTAENSNSYVSNCLVNFYGKCGLLTSARLVFDSLLEPNLVSWASLSSCYFQHGNHEGGLDVFLQSLSLGMEVNEYTCSNVLGACAELQNLELGMQMHTLAIKRGIYFDQFVMTGLVNFYAKCSQVQSAHQVFSEVGEPDLSAWTALIGGYVHSGKGREAIGLFCRFLASGGKLGEKSVASIFGAFADEIEVQVGRQLQSMIIKSGFDSFGFVRNAIIGFYMKSGLLEDSMKVFQEIDAPDIVSWNVLISGYINLGHYDQALSCLRDMFTAGLDPNPSTYSSILCICGDIPATEWGKQTHAHMLKAKIDSNVVVGSALVDMYAKCGFLKTARKVFDRLPSKNLVSWNTILMGYAQHGFGKEALEIYDLMQRNCVKPNHVTFVGVLSACGHVGLLDEGLHHFDSMTRVYGITPRTDHLSCVVSLFARKGQTKAAYDLIQNFRGEPDKVVWRCLLSGCRTRKDVYLGKYAAEKIFSLDPDDTSAYIMLSNIYADLKMWDELADIRKLIKEKELKKDTGCSWTELQNEMFLFSSSADGLQSDKRNLYEVLGGLASQISDEGHVLGSILSGYYG